MRWVKFITRRYTLLEHSMITSAVSEKNNAGKGPYYTGVLDIFRKCLIDIYTFEGDIERNTAWVLDSVKKEPLFFKKHLERGTKLVENLANLDHSLLKKIKNMDDTEIIKELLKLKKKFDDFGPYIDFIHYLEKSGVELGKKYIEKFSKFNDWRKDVFMKFLNFIVLFSKEIAKKKKLKSKELSYLTFSELIFFLKGKIKAKDADYLQKKRSDRCIFMIVNGKKNVITDDFDKEFEKLKKDIISEEHHDILKGIAINKGVITGKVKVIFQTTSLKDIPKGMIIVTHQTKPDMTQYLKGAIAIVTDEGGLLCHAASLAREFGIIGIIGTKHATKVLKDNDVVEVDGENGVVRKIK